MGEQFSADKHCYFRGGYSIKLSCGSGDTVTVDQWLDLTGKFKPCSGAKMAGGPLMKDVPWETAFDFFNGECVQDRGHGKYGRLTKALPSDGFPKCDFTGVSVRRLSNHSNGSNTTDAPTAAPTTAPTSAPTNATDNSSNTTAPTATPTPAPTAAGVTSGAVMLALEKGGFASVLIASAAALLA